MRWKAVIVLLAIALSIAVPPSLSLVLSHDGRTEIGVLDVCHATTPALSSNGDMPCLNACACGAPTTFTVNVIPLHDPLFTQTLISYSNEQPPNA